MPSESNDAGTSRRAFLVRFAGAAFAAPVIASFALDGVAHASEKSGHRQGHANQTSGNQGHPKQCHPNQTSGNQGYPNHGHPKQCHPNQATGNQTVSVS